MPGFLYHLVCAKIVADQKFADTPSAYDRFLMGNLLPDLTDNHNYAHYEQSIYSSEFDRFTGRLKTKCRYGINLYQAESELLQDDDPLRLGIFFHLYVEDHVCVYSDDAVSMEFIQRGLVPIPKIFTLPASLPQTGIARYDNRSNHNWRLDIENLLANPPEKSYIRGRGWVWYTGNLNTVLNFTTKVANEFMTRDDACF